MSNRKYKRVVLKVSGEGLAGADGFGIGGAALERVAGEIASVHEAGVQVAIVIGGGNILRGSTLAESSHIPEATAHYMGMLATVINALALQETLEAEGLRAHVMSSIAIASVAEPFSRRRCIRCLDKGHVVVLAAGTGRPFVTTDTAAAPPPRVGDGSRGGNLGATSATDSEVGSPTAAGPGAVGEATA